MTERETMVSVIIPTYNCARFVGDAIVSALNQRYQNFEVVVIDDGSTDDTRAVVESCQESRDRVRYIHQENGGVSRARNHGIAKSDGEYLLFLDADDLLLPNSLTELASFLDAHPDTGLVYSDGYFCDASGREFMRLSEHRGGDFAGNVLDHIVLDNFIVAPHCAMVRRTCLESLDPPGFDEALSFSADRDIWTRLAQDYTFGYIAVPTCKYRVHGDNMSSRRSGQREDHLLYKYKVLHSAYFLSLPLTARRSFLRRMLLKTLQGEQEAQQALLRSPEVSSLPSGERASLVYFLGTQLILDGDDISGRSHIRTAVEIAPSSVKYRGIWLFAAISPSFARAVLSGWRWLGDRLPPRWGGGTRTRQPVAPSPFEGYLSWSSTLAEDTDRNHRVDRDHPGEIVNRRTSC